MKKLGTWINNKLDHQKHPTRLSIVLIAIESIGAITAGIALAFGDAKEYCTGVAVSVMKFTPS